MFDCNDAWLKYPQHHIWFNKLWLAEQLGYDCGPASVPVSKSGKYIVRPIYNLRGMGLGTYVTELHPNTVDEIQPGYFWCEYFEGTHRTIDYTFHAMAPPLWRKVASHIGHKEDLTTFSKWEKDDYELELPHFFVELSDVGRINVEAIDDRIIEVHLRPNPNPMQYDEMIPVWDDNKELDGYEYVEAENNCDGQLSRPRQGFLVR